MRYIKKTLAPISLKNFNILSLQCIQDTVDRDSTHSSKYPTYENLTSDKAKETLEGEESSEKTIDILRQQLWEEQRGVCCYCMQFIKPDYERGKGQSSIIEHFLPRTAFKEEATNYYNLYLSCCYSEEAPKHEYHCDDAKEEKIISKYIGYCSDTSTKPRKICEDFFKYTTEGEIIPYGKYGSWTDLVKNYDKLDAEQKEIMGTIDVLNLNNKILVKKRKDFFNESIISSLEGKSTVDLQKLESSYESDFLKEFSGMMIYFIRKKLGKYQ